MVHVVLQPFIEISTSSTIGLSGIHYSSMCIGSLWPSFEFVFYYLDSNQTVRQTNTKSVMPRDRRSLGPPRRSRGDRGISFCVSTTNVDSPGKPCVSFYFTAY